MRLCQLQHIWGKHARELAEVLPLQAHRPIFADSSSFPFCPQGTPHILHALGSSQCTKCCQEN